MTSLTPVLCGVSHENQENWCNFGPISSWWATQGEQTERHGEHFSQCWMCGPASSCRCHSESWKHLDILTTSSRGYQQHPHPQCLDTYQPRKKTLQAPYSIMHLSHHTHHHHPLQQVNPSYTHPHSSEPLQCLINLLIHQLNLSQVRSPEPACILDFQTYNCRFWASHLGKVQLVDEEINEALERFT